ncbi:MAG: alpha/beta hydrolase [Clostridia bacterium]|nr:alpha/beta hydrolase [Clostridia bacterium]
MKCILKRWVSFMLIWVVVFSSTIPNQACHKNYKSFEKKIDIGGFSLFIRSEGKGKPTVIFDSGYGDNADEWKALQGEISEDVRTVSYDRAGLKRSDKSFNPRTSMYMVKELYQLLKKASVKGPYILVGHSFGGLNMRLFASEYPDEVAGIVLIDPTPDNLESRIMPTLTPELQEIMKSQFSSEGTYRDLMVSSEQVQGARTSLKYIPLTVIAATNHGMNCLEFEKLWLQVQKETAEFSRFGKLIVAEGCKHNIHESNPKLVLEAIQDMINFSLRCKDVKWRD